MTGQAKGATSKLRANRRVLEVLVTTPFGHEEVRYSRSDGFAHLDLPFRA